MSKRDDSRPRVRPTRPGRIDVLTFLKEQGYEAERTKSGKHDDLVFWHPDYPEYRHKGFYPDTPATQEMNLRSRISELADYRNQLNVLQARHGMNVVRSDDAITFTQSASGFAKAIPYKDFREGWNSAKKRWKRISRRMHGHRSRRLKA